MSVRANVCGNCANFKLNKGEKFFNCTYAKQGGVKYAMQVRADTRSCEAFASLSQPPKPGTTAPLKIPTAKRSEPRPGGLCPWGRIIMLATIIIIILLIAFGAYTLLKGRSTPAPTPTPTATPLPTAAPTPTIVQTPSPAPTPVPIFKYNLGQWITAPPLLLSATSAEKVAQYSAPGPIVAPAGTSFIIVSITMTNGGSQSVFTKATDFTIVSQSGLSFPPVQPPFLFYNTYTYMGGWLDPGQTTAGRIVYIVPNALSQLRLQTSANVNAILQWTLPW